MTSLVPETIICSVSKYTTAMLNQAVPDIMLVFNRITDAGAYLCSYI